MSMLRRRIAKLERQQAPEIAPDQRDPRLIEFFQEIAGCQFKDAEVPCGVSCAAYIKGVMDSLPGNVLGVGKPNSGVELC